MITITVKGKLPYDNEIQMFDVCHGIAAKLEEIAKKALEDGDCDQFIGQKFTVTAPDDDDQALAEIVIRSVGP